MWRTKRVPRDSNLDRVQLSPFRRLSLQWYPSQVELNQFTQYLVVLCNMDRTIRL